MTITKRPGKAAQTTGAEEFIARAPDAAHEAAPEPARRRKEVISLGVDPTLLIRVDAIAARLGLSRASAINLAMAHFADDAEKGT